MEYRDRAVDFTQSSHDGVHMTLNQAWDHTLTVEIDLSSFSARIFRTSASVPTAMNWSP